MLVENNTNYDWWSLGTALVLALAALVLVFSVIPEMASQEMTSELTPEVASAPAPLYPVPYRGAPQNGRIGVAEAR